MDKQVLTAKQVENDLGVPMAKFDSWIGSGKLHPGIIVSAISPLHVEWVCRYEDAVNLISQEWAEQLKCQPSQDYTFLEIFAGAGGLALGMEKAGLNTLLLSELDKHACNTLSANRPNWNVVQGDVAEVDFTPSRGQVDVLSGGFPCQAFSYAGKKRGFEDARGTLFYEFARAVKETSPRVIVAENVRGLLNHDQGKTLSTIKELIDELGYELVEPRVLKAVFYRVPQKREHLFLVAIRKDLAPLASFEWPSPNKRIMTIKDALKAGSLFDTDVPKSDGQKYPESKAEVLKLVPPGGYWRDLPLQIQKKYMGSSFFLGAAGLKGVARRLSWDEPSLTLTFAPSLKQTERCHPDETRPLTVREYARIQTFPDEWLFNGPITAQYRQIANAVPVNLSYAMARSVVRLLNSIDKNLKKGSDMPYLNFISDKELVDLVAEVLQKGINAKNKVKEEKNFNKNVIDPFTTLFDASISNFDHDTWKESEATRQYQKTLTNSVGMLHQKLLGYAEGWDDLGVGTEIDLKNDDQKIIAEIKNKHNTLTAGKLADQYHNLVSKVAKKASHYSGYTAYFVNIVPKKPDRFDIPFVPSDPTTGSKVPMREDVRIIDGASFYALVTGEDDALERFYNSLPAIIDKAFKQLDLSGHTLKDAEVFKQYFTKAFK